MRTTVVTFDEARVAWVEAMSLLRQLARGPLADQDVEDWTREYEAALRRAAEAVKAWRKECRRDP